MIKFIIEDEIHAELCGEFDTFDDALSELQSRARTPYQTKPNICPCVSWKTCSKSYEIIEYDVSNANDWIEKNRVFVFEISANGVKANSDYIN